MVSGLDEDEEARERKRSSNHYALSLTAGAIAISAYSESVLPALAFVAGGIGFFFIANSLHARLEISQRLKSIDIQLSNISAMKDQ